MLTLSKRLQTICDLVTPGVCICDVGCDHAYVDIRLLQEEKISSALAMDVADGPLATAKSNLELTGLSDRCEVRKSDGLAAYEPGEADCMICAGMGGILMRSLLEAEPEKVLSFRELLLSPQSEIHLVREWLFRNGCRIADERFLEEDGKYYTVMKIICPPVQKGQMEETGKEQSGGLCLEGDVREKTAGPCREGDVKEKTTGPWQGSVRREKTAGLCREGDGKAPGETAPERTLMQERPHWTEMADRIETLPVETLAKAMVPGRELVRILRDPGFHRLAEETYGPCILHRFLEKGQEACFQQFLTQTLRGRLKIMETLSAAAAGGNGTEASRNAANRLAQLSGEVGVLQVLMAVRMLNEIRRQM